MHPVIPPVVMSRLCKAFGFLFGCPLHREGIVMGVKCYVRKLYGHRIPNTGLMESFELRDRQRGRDREGINTENLIQRIITLCT